MKFNKAKSFINNRLTDLRSEERRRVSCNVVMNYCELCVCFRCLETSLVKSSLPCQLQYLQSDLWPPLRHQMKEQEATQNTWHCLYSSYVWFLQCIIVVIFHCRGNLLEVMVM